MPVIVDARPPETSSAASIERWRQVPVAVAVDVSQAECQKLADDIMALDTPSEILARCTELAQARFGELLG